MTTAEEQQDDGGGRAPARRRRAIIALMAAALAAAALVAHDWRATLGSADRAQARLDERRADLDRAGDDLAGARRASDARWATLEDRVDTLGTRRAERSKAQRAFDSSSQLLAALKGQLATATSRHEASTQRLQSLQECLVGATKALNQAAVGDGRVTATVRAITGVCAAAGVDL